VLLAAGAEGKRYALPNARILIHQPMGSFQGQASDVAIQAKEILRMRESLNEILAFHTHQDIEKIRKDSDRDFFMSGQEAKDYGIVDHVITRREAEGPKKEK
jgi:ATP-dependent Clp protease protease subunit